MIKSLERLYHLLCGERIEGSESGSRMTNEEAALEMFLGNEEYQTEVVAVETERRQIWYLFGLDS